MVPLMNRARSGATNAHVAAWLFQLMSWSTRALLLVTAAAVLTFISASFLDCALDTNCTVDLHRHGPRMIRTAPSSWF